MADIGSPPGFARFVSLRRPALREPQHHAASAVSREPAAPAVDGVRTVLRFEGAVVLAVALVGYAQFGMGWGVFALWLLAPDLSLLGYLAGPRVGAALYNAAHALIGPVLLLAFGVFAAHPWAVAGGLIWLAHVGLDHALGFGLKYATDFASTHLGRIGRADPW